MCSLKKKKIAQVLQLEEPINGQGHGSEKLVWNSDTFYIKIHCISEMQLGLGFIEMGLRKLIKKFRPILHKIYRFFSI